MGTSRSFRSPPVPRWNAVIAHIANDEPHELIRAELFNAGVLDGWSEELGRPGVAHLVAALVSAHGHLAEEAEGHLDLKRRSKRLSPAPGRRRCA